MYFHHGDILRRRFRGVNLDLVVVLSASLRSELEKSEREEYRSERYLREMFHYPSLIFDLWSWNVRRAARCMNV
jgi:hypothetical protein